jgi:hypothetical protein
MEQIGAEQILQAAKGISDFGMLAMMAGAFLLLSVALMGVCFFWFKNIIDNIIKNNTNDTKVLVEQQETMNRLLEEIADGLRPTTLLQIQSVYNTCFDLSVTKVCQLVKQIREENHIDNREATNKKIRMRLCNIHEDRNVRWEGFRFRGKDLARYTNPKWIDDVAEVVENEVYSEKPNNGRAHANIDAIYKQIRNEFYHNLISN